MTKKELNRLSRGDVVKCLKQNGELINKDGVYTRIYAFEFIKYQINENYIIIRSMGSSKIEMHIDVKNFMKHYEIIK